MPKKQSLWEAVWESIKSGCGGCVGCLGLIILGIIVLFLLFPGCGIYATLRGWK